MITGDIVVLRPAAQGVPPGVSLPAGPRGLPGLDGLPGGQGPQGLPGKDGVTQDISGKLDKTGDASWTTASLAGVTRNTAVKLFERKSVLDFYSSTYNGDFAPAIERARELGGRHVIFPLTGDPYILKRPFSIPNGDIKLVAEGCKQVELRLLGGNDYHGIFGNATTQSFHCYVDNFLFTKELGSTQGAGFKFQNVSYWGVDNCRFYGDNKLWRAVELYAVCFGRTSGVNVDHVLDKAIYANGGTAAFGTPNGGVVDFTIDDWYVSGAVRNPADPLRDGSFYFEDNFQAVRIQDTKVTGARGYAVCMLGTPANQATNAINLIINLNADAAPLPGEEAGHKAGSVFLDAVNSTQISGPGSWTAGQGMPAVKFGTSSNSNRLEGYQIALGLIGAQGVFDDGTLNTVEQNQFVGYDTNADAALVIGPNASRGIYRQNKAQQLKRVIVDQSGDLARYLLDDFAFTNISGQPLTGMKGNTNESTIKAISNIRNFDVTSLSVPASGMLDLPLWGDTFFVNSGGTINGIVPKYIDQEVELILTTTGTVISDVGSAAAGAGAFYLSSPGNVTTDHNRWRMRFRWKGDFWFEIARAH